VTRPPSDSPALYLRLSEGVKARMVREADRAGLSLSAYIERLFRRRRLLEIDAADRPKRRAR